MLRAVCDWVYIAPETLNSEWAGAVRTIRCALNLYIQPPVITKSPGYLATYPLWAKPLVGENSVVGP